MWSLLNIKKQHTELKRKADRIADHTPLYKLNLNYQLFALHTNNKFGKFMSWVPGTSYFILRVKCAWQINKAHYALDRLERDFKTKCSSPRNIYHTYPRSKQKDSKETITSPVVFDSPLKTSNKKNVSQTKQPAPIVFNAPRFEAP